MALSTAERADIINKFKRSEHDTASAQVQIALLTARLNYLGEHFKKNKKDCHSRHGLLKLVGQRRRLLGYLQRKNTPAYKELIAALGLRK